MNKRDKTDDDIKCYDVKWISLLGNGLQNLSRCSKWDLKKLSSLYALHSLQNLHRQNEN